MKYAAFDIGNVICHLDFTNFLEKLDYEMVDYATGHNVDTGQFLIRLQRPHDLGLATMEEELKAFGVDDCCINDLMKAWSNTISPEPVMISLIEELIDNGTKVALLSNIGFEHAIQMKTSLGPKIYDNAVRFFSCEVGARKPTILYYRTFLDMYPEFKGCIYLDDKIDNVEGGKLLGLNGIQFDLSVLKTKRKIKQRIKEIINE